MKKSYCSQDSRTGFAEGEIVELSDEELNDTPFNVKLQLVEKVQEKPKKKAKEEPKESEE